MIRTDNDFFFGSNGSNMSHMLPVNITTREQAFRTAAWILLMGEMLPKEQGHPDVEFEDVLNAIKAT